jgi:hypothetical protein
MFDSMFSIFCVKADPHGPKLAHEWAVSYEPMYIFSWAY